MIFATISTPHSAPQPALVSNGSVYPLPFPDMHAVIQTGADKIQLPEFSFATNEVKFHAPLRPNTLRDAYAFEQHVKTANQNRGREVPEEWYKFPVFYYTNPNSIFGPEDAIPYPHYTQALDFELEIAVIIGKGGINIKPEDAPKHIFGYTIFNDWSARDVQREEMKVGLGPAKGKDFASSLPAMTPCVPIGLISVMPQACTIETSIFSKVSIIDAGAADPPTITSPKFAGLMPRFWISANSPIQTVGTPQAENTFSVSIMS